MSDRVAEVADRASGLGTENGLELGEGEFDGVEVGGVRRQVQQPRSRRLDALSDTADLVGGQIVEHDRFTGPEGWDEGFLDIAAEACARHWSIEERGGHQAADARPAVTVMVFQWPNGTATRQRSPRGARPERRTIFVLVAVSSRNSTHRAKAAL